MRKVLVGLMVLMWTMSTVSAAGARQPAPRASSVHCVSRFVPLGAARHGVLRGIARSMGCFESFSAAIRAGSGGAVVLPSWVTAASLTDAILEAATIRPLRGSALVGTEYNALDYDGSSHNYFGPSTCQDEIIEFTNLPAGEDDVYESGKGFGGCDHNKKFVGPWLAGDSITCTPNCTGYGSLRNEVSSLRYRP
jgi:hypothetical protein